MGGYNKGVANLIDRAVRNGSAKDGPYEANVSSDKDTLELYHYGTMILQIDKGNMTMGGWSNSDRDAISTAIQTWTGSARVQLTRSDRVAKRAAKEGSNVHESGGWNYW